ncbi:(Na+)-NQR maturation NqrM [Vibrio scophthalmi]|uniref:(Na+)-NQR maturation NqrM n=1 Tax=Vibrio scophthalmi TaxID=45658 RepID=UPI003EBDD548
MTFVFALIGFVVVISLMAIGVLFSRKSIAGSCGGLANIDIERECNCEEVCDEHRKTLYQISEPNT